MEVDGRVGARGWCGVGGGLGIGVNAKFLLKSCGPFDLPVGVGEEIINLVIKCVLFKDRDGVSGVGDDPEIRMGDVCRDQDGMWDGDDVMVAADDQGWALDLVELVEGDMGLVEVEVENFLCIFISRSFWSFEKVVVTVLHEVINVWGEAGGIGPEVGAGKGHLPDLIGVADGEEDRVDAAVAPADDIAAIDMKRIAEGVKIVDDHFEADGVAGVPGFAMGAGVDGDDVVVGGEVGDLVAHVVDGAAIAMEKEKRVSLTVRFIVELNSAGIQIMPGDGVIPVLLGIGG